MVGFVLVLCYLVMFSFSTIVSGLEFLFSTIGRQAGIFGYYNQTSVALITVFIGTLQYPDLKTKNFFMPLNRCFEFPTTFYLFISRNMSLDPVYSVITL